LAAVGGKKLLCSFLHAENKIKNEPNIGINFFIVNVFLIKSIQTSILHPF
jgi:hypothetical protein